jgi:hypothetical protein
MLRGILRIGVGVGGFVVAEIVTREDPVFSLGLVDDRDVRRDLLLLDQFNIEADP